MEPQGGQTGPWGQLIKLACVPPGGDALQTGLYSRGAAFGADDPVLGDCAHRAALSAST